MRTIALSLTFAFILLGSLVLAHPSTSFADQTPTDTSLPSDGSTATPTADPALATTGQNQVPFAATGALLVVLGTGALVLARKQ